MAIFKKRGFLISLVTVVLMTFFAVAAQAAVPLTVSPTSVAANSAGVTIQTQAATAGGTVQLNLYYDANGNGVIDTNEWPFQKTVITDNMAWAGKDGPMGSTDNDPTSQNISTSISFMGGIFPAGKYIVKVTDALGQSNTATFTVTPVSVTARTVSGKVYDAVTNAVVPDSLVYCSYKSTGNFIGAAMAAADGSYSLQIPVAGDIQIGFQMKGYVENKNVTLTVPDGGVSNYNLYLTEPDTQITGTVTEYGTGNPVWGANIWLDTSDYMYSSEGFSKGTDGSYSAPAISMLQWNIGVDAPPGYFGIMSNNNSNVQITPSPSSPNVVNFTAHKITAWVNGTITSEDSLPVQGVPILVQRINTTDPALMNLNNESATNSSGQASVGIEAGDWNAFICLNCGNGSPVLVNGVPKQMVFSNSGTTYTGVLAGNTETFTSTAYYADGMLQGTVYQSDGVTPAAYVGVLAFTTDALNGLSQTSIGPFQTQTQTDNNGNFSLPLLGGTWTVYAQDWMSGMTSPTQNIKLTTNGNEVIEQGETISGLAFTLSVQQQSGSGSISGTISYSGSQTNPIYIGLFNTPNIGPNTSPLYVTQIASPGSYTLQNLPDGTYYVGAIMTANPSAVQMTDPYGMYGILSQGSGMPVSVTISGGSAQSGINFSIFDGTQQYPNPFYTSATGSISGTINYSGGQTNPISIGLFNTPNVGPNTSPLYTTQISGPGAYSFSYLPDGTYYVGAVMTANINSIQSTDPYGIYGITSLGSGTPTPVTISGGTVFTNIDFSLFDPTNQYPNPFAAVTQFDGTYTGTWVNHDNGTVATGTFRTTIVNGAFTNTSFTITSGNFGVLFTSGTVSPSGAISANGDAPNQCPGSLGTFTGQITTTASGAVVMTMTYSRVADGSCSAESGSITATLVEPTKIGVFDSGYWYLDSNMSWAWDGTPTDTLGVFGIGLTGAVPIVGDWNGDGTSKIGVYMNGTWYLDMNRNWQWDGMPTDAMYSFGAGLPDAIPVVGDWNGDGKTKIGIYSDGVWYLDANGNGQWDGVAGGDIQATFGVGLVGAVPVVGDWDGSGITKIGIYQNGYWYLDTNGNGQWDGEASGDTLGVFGIGLTNAVPVVGDWNADGITEIGIYQQGYWYLDKNRSWQWEGEPADQFGVFGVGLTGAVPVPGKW